MPKKPPTKKPSAGVVLASGSLEGQKLGKCTIAPRGSCLAMKTAIGTAHEKDRTGLVEGVFPPHIIAIRCKGAQRGTYRNMILAVCPWCAEPLPQGSK